VLIDKIAGKRIVLCDRRKKDLIEKNHLDVKGKGRRIASQP